MTAPPGSAQSASRSSSVASRAVPSPIRSREQLGGVGVELEPAPAASATSQRGQVARLRRRVREHLAAGGLDRVGELLRRLQLRRLLAGDEDDRHVRRQRRERLGNRRRLLGRPALDPVGEQVAARLRSARAPGSRRSGASASGPALEPGGGRERLQRPRPALGLGAGAQARQRRVELRHVGARDQVRGRDLGLVARPGQGRPSVFAAPAAAGAATLHSRLELPEEDAERAEGDRGAGQLQQQAAAAPGGGEVRARRARRCPASTPLTASRARGWIGLLRRTSRRSTRCTAGGSASARRRPRSRRVGDVGHRRATITAQANGSARARTTPSARQPPPALSSSAGAVTRGRRWRRRSRGPRRGVLRGGGGLPLASMFRSSSWRDSNGQGAPHPGGTLPARRGRHVQPPLDRRSRPRRSRSVRATGTPPRSRAASVAGAGWPYGLSAPTEITRQLGRRLGEQRGQPRVLAAVVGDLEHVDVAGVRAARARPRRRR